MTGEAAGRVRNRKRCQELRLSSIRADTYTGQTLGHRSPWWRVTQDRTHTIHSYERPRINHGPESGPKEPQTPNRASDRDPRRTCDVGTTAHAAHPTRTPKPEPPANAHACSLQASRGTANTRRPTFSRD